MFNVYADWLWEFVCDHVQKSVEMCGYMKDLKDKNTSSKNCKNVCKSVNVQMYEMCAMCVLVSPLKFVCKKFAKEYIKMCAKVQMGKILHIPIRAHTKCVAAGVSLQKVAKICVKICRLCLEKNTKMCAKV